MNFIKFGHPQYLYFLGLIPLLILLYIYTFKQKRRASERFSDFRLSRQSTSFMDFKKQKMKFLMLLFSYTFLTIALSRPQFGSRLELIKQQGLDIMVALDISLSMQAEDVKPNRYQKAKHKIQTLIDKLNGDQVGLIVFAGDSFVQCPLTDDYDAAKMLLDVPPQPEHIFQKGLIQPGTDIGRVIQSGIRVFQRREVKVKIRNGDEYNKNSHTKIMRSQNKYRVLILVTDGENLVPSPDLFEVVDEAVREGIHIYTLGVGIPGQGAPIPLHDHKGKFTEYKKDVTGGSVLTRLNDTLLRKISALGGGRYYLSSTKDAELDNLYRDISSLKRRESEKSQFTQHEERFQYFLFLVLALLLGELLWVDRNIVSRGTGLKSTHSGHVNSRKK